MTNKFPIMEEMDELSLDREMVACFTLRSMLIRAKEEERSDMFTAMTFGFCYAIRLVKSPYDFTEESAKSMLGAYDLVKKRMNEILGEDVIQYLDNAKM